NGNKHPIGRLTSTT
ncbi:hypothetical protein VCHENC02_3988B, partial [Vibrio harveyi]